MTISSKQQQHDDDEPEITIDTPGPIPVDPPPQHAAATATATATSTTSRAETHPLVTLVTPTATAVPPEPVEAQVIVTDDDYITAECIVDETTTSATTPQYTTCTVIAPATLAAGYSFSANVNGIDFMVTVPEGGVVQGQSFQVPYPQQQQQQQQSAPSGLSPNLHSTPPTYSSSPIPTGHWRNGLWDCCEVIHSCMFCQALCCTPLLMAQIMTRHKLNIFGIPSDDGYRSTFVIMACLYVGYMIFISTVVQKYVGEFALPLAWSIFITITIANTRSHLRRRYQIPSQCCRPDDNCCCCSCDRYCCYCGGGGNDDRHHHQPDYSRYPPGEDGMCEDVCVGFWCSCCVSIQMARHTHPTKEYQYQCCTPNGLGPQYPETV